jgi:16S rRNA (cytosine1402-N4)-methyltransferase
MGEAVLPLPMLWQAAGVLSYHSLEDRIVKQTLAAGAHSTAPPDLPVELPEHAPVLQLLTRRAETASKQEIEDNPRAASVRLRAAVRVRAGRGGVARPATRRGDAA